MYAHRGRSLPLFLKATRQLGLPSLMAYACYLVGLRSGHYRRVTTGPQQVPAGPFQPVLELPSPQTLATIIGEQRSLLLEHALEIVEGRARTFGNDPTPLQLAPQERLAHWTDYEQGKQSLEVSDIKLLWEPARFGWAFTLGRAYHLTGDERFPGAFWKFAELFIAANPPYLGPNWSSAQEVALRLIALVFALQVFATSSHTTEERSHRLIQAIAAHAARIPPTLVYARAQKNNHLLTEAAGLYTAGLALPQHPSAHRWQQLGWRIFNQALQEQIAVDGGYIQQSTNYHRLMLQVALWVSCLSSKDQRFASLPVASRSRLAAATNWLFELLDPLNGLVPNLGPNDGAYILPLSSCAFHDFRPVLQAAASVYLGKELFSSGPWDELRLWLRTKADQNDYRGIEKSASAGARAPRQPHVLRNPAQHSWAYLRATCFDYRPGHADQLHFDLWWRGLNVALDPGTYQYNSPPPWDNSLARTEVHNTICLENQDQMTRAGRFLWLDWAQAEIASYETAYDGSLIAITAQHNGYLRTGVLHKRRVEMRRDGWWIHDELLPCGPQPKTRSPVRARLHWLLPDWPWEHMESDKMGNSREVCHLRLKSPYGWLSLTIQTALQLPSQEKDLSQKIQLVRGGQLLHGEGQISATWGWISPTYNQKLPALSLGVYQTGLLPLSYTSRWVFP